MIDEYVYVLVKLDLKPGQSLDSVQEIVQECDYRFEHDEIIGTEITDIYDSQVGHVAMLT